MIENITLFVRNGMATIPKFVPCVFRFNWLPGKIAVLSRWRVDLFICQGQLLLEVEAHGLVILFAIPEGAD